MLSGPASSGASAVVVLNPLGMKLSNRKQKKATKDSLGIWYEGRASKLAGALIDFFRHASSTRLRLLISFRLWFHVAQFIHRYPKSLKVSYNPETS